MDAALERARTLSICDELRRRGIELRAVGKEFVGPCPVCGGRDRFAVNPVKRVWNCRHCQCGGDLIALVQHLDRVGFRNAVASLTSSGKPINTPALSADTRLGRPRARAVDSTYRFKRGWELWNDAVPIHGTPAELYLCGTRKLSLPSDVSRQLRFHSACPYAGSTYPCLVSLYRAIDGDEPRAIMRTALTPGGQKIGRMALGEVGRAAIKIDEDENVTTGLCIGEGLETCLAARQLGFQPVWALGSSSAIKRFPVLPGIETLTILAEADDASAKSIRQCGARWYDAGREVILVEPRFGNDVNDAIRAGVMVHNDVAVPPGAEDFLTARRWQPADEPGANNRKPPGNPLQSTHHMRIEWFDEACESCLHDPEYPLIHGLLDKGAMSVIYGDSNSGKTFIATNMSYHVASGRSWNGKKVERGLVAYVAAEGGTGIKRRLAALRQQHSEDIEQKPLFALIRYQINLCTNEADLNELVALIKDAENSTGEKCVWVIVDTLSRAMAGGDENSPKDMGRLVSAADQIRAEIGAHFTYVHHSGKDAARGARGHSLLRAAADTEIEIARNAIAVTKQRDMECGLTLGFGLTDVTIGTSEDGKPISSAVVEWDTENWKGRDYVPPPQNSVPASLRLLTEVVEQAIAEVGQSIRPFSDGPLVTAAPDLAVRSRYFARLVERDDDTPVKRAARQRKMFNRAIKSAIDRKLLFAANWKAERWIWLPS